MSERYEKEIEDILGQANERAPGKPGSKRGRSAISRLPRAGWRPPRVRLNLTPGKLLLAGVALLLIALILGSFVPAIGPFAFWLGIGLFVLGYVLFFARPRRSMERRWRGQSIEDVSPPGGGGPLGRFWRWVTGG